MCQLDFLFVELVVVHRLLLVHVAMFGLLCSSLLACILHDIQGSFAGEILLKIKHLVSQNQDPVVGNVQSMWFEALLFPLELAVVLQYY